MKNNKIKMYDYNFKDYELRKKINNIHFLTSNPKKSQDFTSFGFNVKKFDLEIPEILSSDVEKVALYKSRDTNLNYTLVEDTSLDVQDASFFGTQIKHVYDDIKHDDSYNGKKAIWRISICYKENDNYYIATGELKGILKYPMLEQGYHFERIFAVEKNGEYNQYELLTQEEKFMYGPRFQAIRKLEYALKTNDFKDIVVINEKDIPEWNGEYQIEKTVKEFDYIKTFPPLGHPEHHFNKHPDQKWLKDEKEIENWCKKYIKCDDSFRNERYGGVKFEINNDLTVTLKSLVKNEVYDISPNDGLVKFRESQSNIFCIDNKYITPYFVKGQINIETSDFSALKEIKKANTVVLFINKIKEEKRKLGNFDGNIEDLPMLISEFIENNSIEEISFIYNKNNEEKLYTINVDDIKKNQNKNLKNKKIKII